MRHLGTTPRGEEIVSCALCDGTDTRPLYEKFGLTIVQCQHCGLVFANPRHPKEIIWQRYSATYFHDEYLPALGVINGQVDFAVVDGRYRGMLALLEQYEPGKGRLFEVGAGSGLFLAAAARAGWEVSGVELSSAGVAFARDRLGLDVREGRAEDIPLDVRTFDVVVMFDVIEHLYDPVAVLRAIRAIVRPGGLVVVVTPNFDALSRYMLGPAWATINPMEHLYHFSERTLCAALAATGFHAVTSIRRHVDCVFDAMNAHHTHAPESRRTAAYAWLVKTLGPSVLGTVLAAGKGDILVALARG